MAQGITGSFELTGNNGIAMRFSYTETYDIATNASTVKLSRIEVKSSWYAGVTYYLDGTVKIGGTTVVTASSSGGTHRAYLPSMNSYASITGTLGSANIVHEDDGSKTATVTVSLRGFTQSGGAGSGWTVSGSKTVTLTKIPRVSQPTAPDAELGQTITIRTNRASDQFTHTLSYAFGSASGEIATDVGDSAEWTPPIDLASQVPNAERDDAIITCVTYSGGVEIGRATALIELSVPADIAPTITSFSAERIDGTVPAGWGVYVQSISKAKLTVSADGAYGSDIASYTVNGQPGSDVTVNLPDAGDITFEAIATDTRGRQARQEITIHVEPCTPPTFSRTPELYRCTSGGQAADDGTYLYARVDASYSPVGGRNAITVSVAAVGRTESLTSGVGKVCFGGLLDAGTSYTITATVTDLLGNVAVHETTVATAKAAFHIMPGGNGAAFFKFAETEGMLEVDGDLKATGDAEIDGGLEVHGDITHNGQPISGGGVKPEDLLALIYPVGSVYMSVNNVSPQAFIGGTWERIKDTFLLSAGDTYAAGSSGGEAEHTLTENEMPKHKHEITKRGYYGTTSGSGRNCISRNTISTDPLDTIADCSEKGGGAAHNNMPPYLAVYMWQRTA